MIGCPQAVTCADSKDTYKKLAASYPQLYPDVTAEILEPNRIISNCFNVAKKMRFEIFLMHAMKTCSSRCGEVDQGGDLIGSDVVNAMLQVDLLLPRRFGNYRAGTTPGSESRKVIFLLFAR